MGTVRTLWALGAAGIVAIVLLALFSSSYAQKFFLEQSAQRAQSTLRLTVAALNGTLNRYEPLPELIAGSQDVRTFLAQPSDRTLREHLNNELKKINGVVSASDIYIMTPDGLTVAASNFDSQTSFIGKNFGYRPYFTEAMAGRMGRYFALGTTSLKRGYYFSAPVRRGDTILGAVAVKMEVGKIEAAWKSADYEILVVDREGIVFMSSRPDWRFGTIRPLSKSTLERLSETRRYPADRLYELPLTISDPIEAGYRLAAFEKGNQSADYLVKASRMPAAGWTVYVLANTAPAKTQGYTTLAVGILLLLTLLLAGAILVLRRHSLLVRLAAQQAARDELEQRVEERTSDLNQANAKLLGEIAERKSAEEELRRTQADLVQAGKLAALGQMSAALSHEFNQPLAAAKAYADNAATFIDRGQAKDARENITRISTLTDRMAAIGKHLRNFARKPDEKLATVPVETVVKDALEIVAERIRQQSVELVTDLGDRPSFVLGGPNRLQQVLVNLLGNALDALEHAPEPRIEIRLSKQETDRVALSIRDNGPGIDAAADGKIFDPFFTTKGVGKGLGLGLSISYNIIKDFGGSMSVATDPDGGAVFTIDLAQAESLEAAE